MLTLSDRNASNARARWVALALALAACLFGISARAEADGMLRVKLARLGSPAAIEMQADCDYYLSGDPSARVPAGTAMTLSASGGGLTLTAGGRSMALGAGVRLTRAESGSRGVRFTSPALSNRFCGDLSFTATGDAISTVLHIYIEDYLYGVVGCEMPPSSGLEALKAQAIVARNYAMMQKAARADADSDLSDTGDALSFRGYSDAAEYANALRAVDDTRGVLIFYADAPAVCRYCESNGGQTESAANAGFGALAYSDVKDDPYDLESAGVKRTASLRRDAEDLSPDLTDALIRGMAGQLEELGLSADPADVRIDAIEAAALEDPRFAAPSRLYRSLSLRLSVTGLLPTGEARRERVSVSVPTYGGLEDWYRLGISEGDSETVWLAESDSAFEVTFRRSGSGVGMSQRGAQVMAREGFSCENILDFYYPGTELRKLELKRASGSDTGTGTAAQKVSDPIATARLGQKTRLYDRAGEGASSLAVLPAGATVQVYAVQGDWAAVGSGGLYGFARTEAFASFSLEGVAAVQVKDETIAHVGDSAEVLQLPVSTAKALDRLPAGSAVRLNAYTDQWALVTTARGLEGFIPRDALTLQAKSAASGGKIVTAPADLYGLLTEAAGLYVNADDSIAPRRTLDKDSRVRILAYNGSWACVRTEDDLTGYVKLNCLSAVRQSRAALGADIEGGEVTTVKGAQYRYVAAEALPLYEGYSTESAVLATLSRGEKVRLGAYNSRWACVRTGGLTGFVLADALAEAPPEGADDVVEGGKITTVKGTQYAVVVTDGAPLYPAPNGGEAPLAKLSEGDRVRLGAYNAVWACVRVGDVTGFMRVEALELAGAGSSMSFEECEATVTGSASVYDKADLSGAPSARLEKGAKVRVYAWDSLSAYVEFDGRRGFVALKKLKKLP